MIFKVSKLMPGRTVCGTTSYVDCQWQRRFYKMKKSILLLIILLFSQTVFGVSLSDSPVIYENKDLIKSDTIKVYKMDRNLTQKFNTSETEIEIPNDKILLKTFDGTRGAVCDETVILNADDVRELCILNNYFSICCVYTPEEIKKFKTIKEVYCNQYLAIEINGVLTGTTYLLDFMTNARVINFYYEFGKIINDEDVQRFINVASTVSDYRIVLRDVDGIPLTATIEEAEKILEAKSIEYTVEENISPLKKFNQMYKFIYLDSGQKLFGKTLKEAYLGFRSNGLYHVSLIFEEDVEGEIPYMEFINNFIEKYQFKQFQDNDPLLISCNNIVMENPQYEFFYNDKCRLTITNKSLDE